MARSSYPPSKARGGGWKEQPHAKELWLCGRRRAKGSYSTFKVRRGGHRKEEPHIQVVVAAQAQKGLERLSHVEGQERQW